MSGPLIVQSDYSLLLEAEHPQYETCRDFLASVAEMVKAPEFVQTWRITPLTVWNAAALGVEADALLASLSTYSRYPVPDLVRDAVREWHGAYGRLVLEPHRGDALRLRIVGRDPAARALYERLRNDETLRAMLAQDGPWAFLVAPRHRGDVKQSLIKIGCPTHDVCGFAQGAALNVSLRGEGFALRDYQVDAVDAFERGGHGVIVLPCGAGKTMVGLGAMARASTQTLIVTTHTTSALQWRHELLDKTHLSDEAIGLYTGNRKEIRPVTITTYQMLTHRSSRDGEMGHLALFTDHPWGLIVYDEVHLLPAPVFRATAAIQAKRRLGLTATLVREDGREDEVFALIGPKRAEVPWKVLEQRGFIAQALCTEVRIVMPAQNELDYARAEKRERFRIAAENPRKVEVVEELLARHPDRQALVIGGYLSQVGAMARALRLPLVTGTTPQAERERLYAAFRAGDLRCLVVSKVANFALDLPDASLLIQVSGTYGSRQEEAQRLGRILRPKAAGSLFYSLISKGTDEQSFGARRQVFLVEQGYEYRIQYRA